MALAMLGNECFCQERWALKRVMVQECSTYRYSSIVKIQLLFTRREVARNDEIVQPGG